MSPRFSDPPRTATEQLLLSTATDLAVGEMDLSRLSGRKAVLDPANVDGYDKAYALGALAQRLNEAGALLVGDRKDAEAVVSARAGALSADRADMLIGVPELSVPTPFGGQLRTPEIAFLKQTRLTGIVKLALHAYEHPSGKHILSVGPLSGKSYYTLWTVLGLSFRVTDIPEKAPGNRWWPWGT
jgi:hypothetical protein